MPRAARAPGSRSRAISPSAARCTAEGKTSFDDWPMLTWSFACTSVACEVRDHLVRVHVRARAGTRLEDVDRELVVELACGDPIGGCGDAARQLGVEELEVGVGARGGGLDPAEPVRHGGGNRLTGDGEVGDGLVGLAAPKLVGAHNGKRRRAPLGPASVESRDPGATQSRRTPRAPARSRARRCRSAPSAAHRRVRSGSLRAPAPGRDRSRRDSGAARDFRPGRARRPHCHRVRGRRANAAARSRSAARRRESDRRADHASG